MTHPRVHPKRRYLQWLPSFASYSTTKDASTYAIKRSSNVSHREEIEAQIVELIESQARPHAQLDGEDHINASFDVQSEVFLLSFILRAESI